MVYFNLLPDKIKHLIEDGAIFYCSHSGGKDSQAMSNFLREIIPAEQLCYVHANLGEVEWDGVISHIKNTIDGLLNIVQGKNTLLQQVEKRFQTRPNVPSWPSPRYRQCTSDLKTGPIMKFIRNDLKARGKSTGVNCVGIRAEESSKRAQKQSFSLNVKGTVSKRVTRTLYDWLPIFDWSEAEVYDFIDAAGQKPFWAYGDRGSLNSRLSCVFCIMGSKSDLRHGAKENPELFQKYLNLEKKTGYTMFQSKGENIPLNVYMQEVA